MNYNELKTLLEKFYEGETTLEEERLLEEFFLHNNVDEEFEPDKQLFMALHHASASSCPQEFEQRLSEAIAQQAKTDAVNDFGRRKKTKRIISFAAIAASLAIAVTIGWNILGKSNSNVIEIDDPDQAYEITASLLTDFSNKLNNGIDQVNEIHAMTASITNYKN